MSKLPLPQAIQRIQDNDERMDRFANGGDTESWTTSGGIQVPSLAKFVKDHDAQLGAFKTLIESPNGAADVGTTPAGGLAATNVQAALNELDSEKTSFVTLALNNGSSLIGFIQSGTGAVLRTVQSKLRDVISVIDWGSPTTSTVASAISSVQSTGGGTLNFPNGSYSGVTLPSNYGGVSLEYNGPDVPASLFGETAGSTFIGQRIHRYMGSSAHSGKSHAAYVIEHDAIGTGVSGADHADFGIGISMRKKGFGSGSAAAGEIDGGYIIARNDGSDSDTTALLFDVANYGVGFNALWEGSTSAITGSTIVHRVSVQSGVIDTRTGDINGHVVSKHNGVGGAAYFAQQGGGGDHTGRWQYFMRFRTDSGQIRFDMPISGSDVVAMKLYDSSGNSKTLRCDLNSLAILNNAGLVEILHLDDTGALTVPSTVIAGNFSTIGNVSTATLGTTGDAAVGGNIAVTGTLTTGKAGLTSYTPTLRPANSGSGGSYTTASVTGHYHVVGTMCYVTIKVTITTVGTGTAPIVSLPFSINATAEDVSLVGRENVNTGKACVAIRSTSTEVVVTTADNASPAANGAVIVISGMYPIA